MAGIIAGVLTTLHDGIQKFSRRCRERGDTLAVAVALIALFILGGELSWRWGLAGLAGAMLWAGLWPAPRAFHSVGTQPLPQLLDVSRSTTDAPAWRTMLEALPDPTMVLDAGDVVLAANSAALSIYPSAERQRIGHVDRAPELLQAIERTRSTGDPQSFNLRATVPIERHLSGIATALVGRDSDKAEPAILLYLRDRTEVERLAQMRADFVANASHELRTPLASLKGFVETLQGAAKDDPVARERFLGIMQAEASRMSRLIEDLLSLSRIEMREHVAPREAVDLVEIVAGVVKALEPLAAQEKRTLAVSKGEQPALVLGDKDELAQVAQNLMQNAIKYGRERGRVDVTIKREDARIALVVADDGIGIAPEHLPRLTERFYRVSAKESRERGGTGLGLAIVKHIVNRHRGELRIETRPGKGSTFTVLLPRAEG